MSQSAEAAAQLKGRFPFFMVKEIYEQPEAIRKTIDQHLDPATRMVRLDRSGGYDFAAIRSVCIIASGSSRHAGLCGKRMIEELAGLPVEVEHASEYSYRRPIRNGDSLVIAITQSGETADTTAALRTATENGIRTLSVSNVPNSTIAREADANFFTCAGKEVAIPATKSFTAQLTAMYMLAVLLAEKRGTLTADEARHKLEQLSEVPAVLETLLEKLDEQALAISQDYFEDQVFIYLGRGVDYPIALEGALKLKEVSYVHAEGYPTGELRHGPTALIDASLPVVAIVTRNENDEASTLRYEKSMALLREIRQKSTRQILVASETDTEIEEFGKYCFRLPEMDELLMPILEVVPLQFLAFHIANLKGFNVDQPRNLVKSVQVE